MVNIEIDFDVFKEITMRRKTESVSANDVLRELLGLPAQTEVDPPEAAPKGGWTTKGVTFPDGTDFRGRHKGQITYAKVQAGALVVNGKRYDSPSPAATAVTGTIVNGWIFWECRLPGQTNWQLMKRVKR